ncbi:MAG: RecQ family ATP-dependent DNA helicase [Candidatus Sumerlaeota bacterium]|nr:RecQ family ATP-dependent DNA helicase [Candidatus Sumerlaeota bacterium]
MADFLVSAAPADPQGILTQRFGFESFRPGQREVIDHLLAGRHVLAVMPTGSGKSLCYQLPALAIPDSVTLVVSPLISLMKDQVDDLNRLDVPSTFINSSISAAEQQARIESVRRREYHLVYVAPERFRSPSFLRLIEQTPISIVAIDEAHCVSEWGHDFRPDYLKLRGFLEAMRPHAVAALTATATPPVQVDIVEQLGLQNPEIIVTGFDRPSLAFSVRRFSHEKDKPRFAREFVQAHRGSGIVYVGTRKAAEEIANLLYSFGEKAEAYHAGLDEAARTDAQDRFMAGETRVLVGTNAFGMGIDKSDVRFVLHYSMPGSPEQYYQEAGRAGRDGERAHCLLCSSGADYRLQEFFIDQAHPPRDQIQRVYEALAAANANPVFLSPDQLRRACGNDLTDLGAASCLRILEQAGAIQQMDARERLAAILGSAPAAQLRSRIKGKRARGIFDAFAERFASLDGEIREENVNLEFMAGRLGIDSALLERQLRDWHSEGVFEFYPPFRGRGVRLLTQGEPFQAIPIDWDSLARRKRIEHEKLDAMIFYVGAKTCRRAWLTAYFGERVRPGRDGCACDRCGGVAAIDHPSAWVDSTARAVGYTPGEVAVARAVLEGVAEMPWKVGVQKIVQVVCGSRAAWIVGAGLERLKSFGAAQVSQDTVSSVAQRLARDGYLEQTAGKYPVVSLAEPGRDLLAGRCDLPPAESPSSSSSPLSSPSTTSTSSIPSSAAPAPANDEELFNRLRALRMKEAKRRHTQAYKILSDEALKSVVRLKPNNPVEFLNVKGVGPAKAQKFAGLFLAELDAALGRPPRQDEPSPSEDSEAFVDSAIDPELKLPPAAEPAACASSIPSTSSTASEPLPPVDSLPDPSAVLDALARSFLESERDTAREAYARLRLFDRQAILDRLIAAGDGSPSQRVQLRLIWATGDLELPAAEGWLAGRLESPDAELRRPACEALRKIGGPRAERLLLELLLKERDDTVQASAVAALGWVGGAGAAFALERFAASGASSERLRGAARSALERLRHSATIPDVRA